MPRQLRLLVLLATIGLSISGFAVAKELAVDFPPGVKVPQAAMPGPDFNVEQATQAYLALLTPEQRARSDAYFEGRNWLRLWEFLYGLVVLLGILSLRWSARLREWAEKVSSRPSLQALIYALMYTPLIWALSLPLFWYTGYVREHQYGLSNQDFGGWLGDEFKSMLLVTALTAIAVVIIYGFVRRAAERWWLWATGFIFVFLIFVFMITPVFVNPVFNKYQPLEEGPVREAVLSLARANRIPVDDVNWYDASKQTKRISAHVAGMLGTTQVSLNDNLLNRTSLPEIKAVLGHEMGHYVLSHAGQGVFFFTLIFGIGFWILEKLMRHALARWGQRWGIRERADPAGLPLALGIISVYLFLTAPILSRYIYMGETQADLYGLNASREPYGFATVAMRLGAYRKLEPSTLEEILFYDHPSGKRRVEMAMRWVGENQALMAEQAAASTEAGTNAP